MSSETFVLRDEKDKALRVTVTTAGTLLNIYAEGYGNQVSLDWYGGELRLLTNLDHENDEPKITVLEPEPCEGSADTSEAPAAAPTSG